MKGHNYGYCRKCNKIHIPNKGNLGKHLIFSEGHCKHLSEAKRGKPNPKHNAWVKEHQSGVNNPFYHHHHSEETKAILRAVCPQYAYGKNKGKSHPGESNPFYGRHYTLEMRAQMSLRRKELCQSSDYLHKIMVARDLKPNKSEQKLTEILDQCYPGQWRYVGDGKDGTVIGGKIPDWLNINGQKAVIEMFSDYWHSLSGSYHRTAEGTREHYAKYGFKCLIVDWKEVRKPETLLPKLSDFVEGL